MLCRFAAGLFVFALVAAPLTADDKKDPKDKPVVWVRENNGVEITFTFSKDKLKGTVLANDNGFVATGKITIDKDGVVKCKLTEVDEKGKFPALPKVGLEFSFKWKVTGDTAELSDLKGDDVEDAKPVVEGEYKKKK